MARFLSLSSSALGCLGVAGLGWIGCLSTPANAQTAPAPTNAAPAKPAPPKTPAPTAAQQAQEALGRYGSIIVPSDEMTHPLRLRLPFPGVGEVKIPTKGELVMREKLEQLAALSDEEIHVQLAKWPAYSKMSLRDQASMLARIQDFRDYRSKIALQKAHDMGLLTMTDEQKKKFEKDYWDKRLQMDSELAKQFDPIYRAREQKFKDELYREFSSASGVPVMQGPKPVTKKTAPPPPKNIPPPAPATATNTPTPPAKTNPSLGTTAEPSSQQ